MFRLGDRRPLFEVVAGRHARFPEVDLGHEVVLGHPAKVLTDCLGPRTGRRGGHPRSWAFAASCWTEAATALPAERVASWPSTTSGTQLLSPGARHVQTMRTEPSAVAGVSAGIRGDELGPRRCSTSVPVLDFAVGRPMTGRSRAPFEKHPNIAACRVRGPRRLCSGQALAQVLLRAVADGPAHSVTSQPLERPETW